MGERFVVSPKENTLLHRPKAETTIRHTRQQTTTHNIFTETQSFTSLWKANIRENILNDPTEGCKHRGIPCLVVNVDFNIENISADGGRVVAFLESPKGVGVKDTNGRFCTTGGKVCFSKEFGTRQPYSTFRNFQLAIPMEELHITNPSKDHFIRVAVYDYASKKYVKLGQYVTL